MRLALLTLVLAVSSACGPGSPCAASRLRVATRAARPYAGHWKVARGDTLTFPQMGDRFRLARVHLDTAPVVWGSACRFRGAIVFAEPRAESLGVTWTGGMDQALVYGWPADLGPFGGIGVSVAGDSLHGALLFDARLGVNVKPGVTAQFVARRAPAQ